MTAVSLNFFGRLLSLSWLTGPIFEKELRVSSRRARNYVLRSLYVFSLMILLGLVWIRVIEPGGSALYTVSRMAEAGKAVIMYTVWFQFCITQVFAVIMLSTSISDEIHNRTLGLLMTTPINSFQIVMGKLLSKLLQLILLLTVSLPLLAIVRVFGGVPWGYVVSSLCITLTTMIFFGSLSLLFSIFTRRAYVVIIATVIALFLMFAALPYLTGVLWFVATEHWPGKTLTSAIFCHNPYLAMLSTSMMMLGRGTGGTPSVYWPLHCGVVSGLSALVLLLSVVSVRRVALRQATGQSGVFLRKRRPRKNADRQECSRPPIRVVGPPVLWKELKSATLGRRKGITRLAVAVCGILILLSYFLCFWLKVLKDTGIHFVYTFVYLGLGMLFTIVIPSTCISSEKESRSWPLLLTTTLNDRDILFGKFVGALRRCLPVWLLLLGHILVFSLTDAIHPIAVPYMAILIFWVTIFLCGSGLYFSSCCRRTTTAVILNFAFAFTIWAIVPLLVFFVAGAQTSQDYLDTNPVVHAGTIMEATIGKSRLRTFYWIGSGRRDASGTMTWILICMGVHTLAGSLFALRAKRRFRRNIF